MGDYIYHERAFFRWQQMHQNWSPWKLLTETQQSQVLRHADELKLLCGDSFERAIYTETL